MSNSLEIFALRHAEPLGDIDADLGIGNDQIPFVKQAAQTIGEQSAKGAQFSIYTSVAECAIETGNVLYWSKDIKASVCEPQMHDTLFDEYMNEYDENEQAKIWTDTLRTLGGRALMRNLDGLILVTHAPLLRTMPFFHTKPDTNYLAVNHFTYTVA